MGNGKEVFESKCFGLTFTKTFGNAKYTANAFVIMAK